MTNFLRFMAVGLISVTDLACAKSTPVQPTSTATTPVATPAATPPTTASTVPLDSRCADVSLSHKTLRYCFVDPLRQGRGTSAQVNVIYFFHGLGGTPEDLFSDQGRQIIDALALIYRDKMPIVVGLSLGSSTVFGDDTAEIIDKGLPQVEGALAPGKQLRRIVIGGSMGGHNALRLVGERPANFAAIAALCPAVGTFNGYDEAEVAAYIERNKAIMDVAFFRRALEIYKKELSTPAKWVANNPFTFLDRGAYDGIPIFLSVGREDTLGFVEGSREFKRRADLRPAMKVDYHEFRGPHCTFDLPAFVRFMSASVPR